MFNCLEPYENVHGMTPSECIREGLRRNRKADGGRKVNYGTGTVLYPAVNMLQASFV